MGLDDNDYKAQSRWNGFNNLLLIRIDLLLIIFKPESLFAHPASCTVFHKISNNHEGQQSSPIFPKATVDHMFT